MATSYVSRAVIPHEYLTGMTLEALRNASLKAKQTVTTSAASTQANTVGVAVEAQEVFYITPIATPVWAAFGTAPVAAVGTDHYLAAGVTHSFLVPAGQKVALIDHV